MTISTRRGIVQIQTPGSTEVRQNKVRWICCINFWIRDLNGSRRKLTHCTRTSSMFCRICLHLRKILTVEKDAHRRPLGTSRRRVLWQSMVTFNLTVTTVQLPQLNSHHLTFLNTSKSVDFFNDADFRQDANRKDHHPWGGVFRYYWQRQSQNTGQGRVSPGSSLSDVGSIKWAASLQINNALYSRESSLRMAGLWMTTTSRRSQHCTWYFGEFSLLEIPIWFTKRT